MGCPAHVKKYDTYKLESRIDLVRFVGYLKGTFMYYFYGLEEQSIFIAKRCLLRRQISLEKR